VAPRNGREYVCDDQAHRFVARRSKEVRALTSSSGRPVIYSDFRHREIVDVRGGDISANSESGSRNQTVGLMKGHSSVSELTSPCASTDSLSGAQRREPQTVEQPSGYWFLGVTQPAPDLLDRNSTHPWLHPDPSEPGHSRRRGSPPERVN